MANVVQLANLKNQIPYYGDGLAQFLEALHRNIPAELKVSDGLSYYQSNLLTTTAVAIKASAGKVYGVFLQSAGALGYLSLWNLGTGSVTVGTTSQTAAFPISATSGQSMAYYMVGSAQGTSPLWNTAITAAVATTVTGSSAVATLPTVIIAYS